MLSPGWFVCCRGDVLSQCFYCFAWLFVGKSVCVSCRVKSSCRVKDRCALRGVVNAVVARLDRFSVLWSGLCFP